MTVRTGHVTVCLHYISGDSLFLLAGLVITGVELGTGKKKTFSSNPPQEKAKKQEWMQFILAKVVFSPNALEILTPDSHFSSVVSNEW